MPGRDRTGPAGMGSLTGGGFGDCAGDPALGPVAPRRFFRGWGGRGRRSVYRATGLTGWQRAGSTAPWAVGRRQAPSQAEEAVALRNQVDHLRAMLEDAEARLQDLDEPRDE